VRCGTTILRTGKNRTTCIPYHTDCTCHYSTYYSTLLNLPPDAQGFGQHYCANNVQRSAVQQHVCVQCTQVSPLRRVFSLSLPQCRWSAYLILLPQDPLASTVPGEDMQQSRDLQLPRARPCAGYGSASRLAVVQHASQVAERIMHRGKGSQATGAAPTKRKGRERSEDVSTAPVAGVLSLALSVHTVYTVYYILCNKVLSRPFMLYDAQKDGSGAPSTKGETSPRRRSSSASSGKRDSPNGCMHPRPDRSATAREG
jgi:hypothetical protein